MESSSKENVLKKQIKAGNILWVESFIFVNPISFDYAKGDWLLTIAFNSPLELNGEVLPFDCWSIHYAESSGSGRVLSKSGKGQFLFISIHENYYDFNFNALKHQAPVSVSAMRCILNILSKAFGLDTYSEIWVENYLYLLLAELSHSKPQKSSFTFEEIKCVYGIVNSIEITKNPHFPKPSELVRLSQMPTHRLQRACLETYGLSMQSIIQHLKLKRAFEDIVYKKVDPSTSGFELGFKYYGNFVTAFKKYYGVTPASLASFYSGSPRLF